MFTVRYGLIPYIKVNILGGSILHRTVSDLIIRDDTELYLLCRLENTRRYKRSENGAFETSLTIYSLHYVTSQDTCSFISIFVKNSDMSVVTCSIKKVPDFWLGY
jgi:hypothetical protein